MVCVCVDLQLTVIEVAQVSCIEEEVCSEKVPKAPTTWPEWKRSVQVEPTCPEHLSTQIITCQ